MTLAEDRKAVTNALDAVIRGTRREVRLVLIGNVIIGLGWLLGAEHRTDAGINEPAKALLGWQTAVYPMRVYGAVLLCLAVVAAIAFYGLKASVFQWAMYSMTAYWAFWTILFADAVIMGSAAGVNAVLAGILARRIHVLAGVSFWTIHRG